MTAPDGLLLIDKPGGLTSHDVVARARRALATKKVGHAGTLDPMATGLLVLGVGRATRLLTYIVGRDKVYEATIRLGQSTITDDAEGDLTGSAGAHDAALTGLDDALAALTGTIRQVPSAVSAVKVGGRRAYARVRAGEEVDLPAREVTVHRLDLLDRRAATSQNGTPVVDLDVVVACSTGTYVRAIARDLGAALGTGGHLTSLRRTEVGPFDVADAVMLESLASGAAAAGASAACAPATGSEGARGRLMSLTAACRVLFRGVVLDEHSARDLRHGRPIYPVPGTGVWAAFDAEGHVIGLVENRGDRARAGIVLNPA
ncbi:MAG TPA: tRNA pseudouridine(55) synthase TruB [Actinomycetaceae bacterium]|nr:tRNA pseudouridine(55) synthase TruB [Actinomycetaceae bacterium]